MVNDYFLIREFRERLIERYDAVSLCEVLGLSVEDLWEAFSERMMDNQELIEELGITQLNED